jgi:hypothetical protein
MAAPNLALVMNFVEKNDLTGMYITYHQDDSIGYSGLPQIRGIFKKKFQLYGETYFTFEHPLDGTVFSLNQLSFMNEKSRITFAKEGTLIKRFP